MLTTPLRTATALLLLIGGIGVVGYMTLSGMSLLDAVYMTAITLSTVGYREVVPLTPAAQLFTIGLIFSGLGVVLYGASLVAGDVIEGRLQRVFGRRRVQRQIEQLADHYVVCGFGRMGRIVCKELATKPVPFVVVEKDPATVRLLDEQGFMHVDGDATEDAVLHRAGIGRARGLVSALSRDEDNVYVVLSARQLKADLLIVARAEDDRSEIKLLRAGASRVVSPYVIGGSRMAGALLRPAVLDIVDLATHHRSIELRIEELVVAPDAFPTGVSLQDAGLRDDESGLIVIAVKKASGEMIFNPAAQARIEAGDRLVVMGQQGALQALEQRLGRPA